MTDQQQPSKALHISLWVVQIILAAALMWAGILKLIQPANKTALMWPWAGQVSQAFLKFTGLVDLLAGCGLLFPSLLRIKPQITVLSAIGIIVLMVFAAIFHIARGEAASIAPNIVFAGMAAFIAWGRFKKAVITAR